MSIIKLIVLSILYGAIVAVNANGQSLPDSIAVTYNKTSSVVFPSVIESVDRGSNDVIAQKAKGVLNVLQIKAGRRQFPGETNLTVITTDGRLYHFIISYADQPGSFTYPVDYKVGEPMIFESVMTPEEFNASAKQLLEQSGRGRVKSTHKNDMRLTLDAIGVRDDALFFQLTIENRSNINFDTELLRFFIRDRKRVKRTATQEIPVQILYRHGDDHTVSGKSSSQVVFAVKKFTIPDAKVLVIQLMESNGGRHLQLNLKNKHINAADTVGE